MADKWKIVLASAIALLFVAINLFFISHNNYFVFLFPLALIALLLLLFAQEYLYWALIFLTPLSINLSQQEWGLGISLPTEPILIAFLVFFVLKILRNPKLDVFLLKHPITIAILFYLGWMFVTSISSYKPLVSFKFLLAHLWFIVPLYFMAFPLFKKNKNSFRFFWLTLISLALVVVYTMLMHSSYGFSEEVGRWIMSPFYNDHTAYGMVIALMLPVLFGFLFWSKSLRFTRIAAFGFLLLFLPAFYLSYSRAAWLSFGLAIFVFILMKLRIRFRYLMFLIMLGLVLVWLNKQRIDQRLEKNETQSSEVFMDHLKSSTNVMSDASNLERINRWNSALRLFYERPILGWGPGTYQFVYGPFQRSDERTIISTNSGDAGTAHSEYLGPLAESGILGFFAISAVFLILMVTGFRVHRTAKNETIKFLAMITTLAFVTYLSHGILNNFLDTDKAAIPFWTLAAILAALDWQNQQDDEKVID